MGGRGARINKELVECLVDLLWEVLVRAAPLRRR